MKRLILTVLLLATAVALNGCQQPRPSYCYWYPDYCH
jgi:hypothetical protein